VIIWDTAQNTKYTYVVYVMYVVFFTLKSTYLLCVTLSTNLLVRIKAERTIKVCHKIMPCAST